MRAVTPRRVALLIGAVSIVGMGTVTVACSPRTEKPAEPGVSHPAPTVRPVPTEKAVHTDVTRSPMVAVPPGGHVGNPAVPCGFGPAGGLPCTR